MVQSLSQLCLSLTAAARPIQSDAYSGPAPRGGSGTPRFMAVMRFFRPPMMTSKPRVMSCAICPSLASRLAMPVGTKVTYGSAVSSPPRHDG